MVSKARSNRIPSSSNAKGGGYTRNYPICDGRDGSAHANQQNDQEFRQPDLQINSHLHQPQISPCNDGPPFDVQFSHLLDKVPQLQSHQTEVKGNKDHQKSLPPTPYQHRRSPGHHQQNLIEGFELTDQTTDTPSRQFSHENSPHLQELEEQPQLEPQQHLASTLPNISRPIQPFVVSPLPPTSVQLETPPHLKLCGSAPPLQFTKQSGARKLIKSFLGRSSHQNSQIQNIRRNSSNIVERKQSARIPRAINSVNNNTSSNPTSLPSSLHTVPSQISLDQKPTELSSGQQVQDLSLQSLEELFSHPRFSTNPSTPDLVLLQRPQPQIQSEQTEHPQAQPHSTAQLVCSDSPQRDLWHSSQQPNQQKINSKAISTISDAEFQPRPQQYYEPTSPTQGRYQPQLSQFRQLSTTQISNPETVSQFSHESTTDNDKRSITSLSLQTSVAAAQSQHVQSIQSETIQRTPPIQSTVHLTQSIMPGNQGVPRRLELEETAPNPQEESVHGSSSGYRSHSRPSPGTSTNSQIPPLLVSAMQPASYHPDQHFSADDQQQKSAQQIPQQQQQTLPPPPQSSQQALQSHRSLDHGRNSPQPSASEISQTDKEMKELVTKYKNVKRLYFDGKSIIEQLNAQVEQLQNAIANQRMSQSRTLLDDNEYIKLFDRLNGAINNLSFNIRKDWRSLPHWIERYVSPDALKIGKQEMTAVGRAVVACWIMDEIFNKCFHPALDVSLSLSLKEIELNIRRFSYTMKMQEEHNALTTKIVTWRMTTLEGLDRRLNSPVAGDNYSAFISMATQQLTGYLFQFLADPPPPGIEGSVSMIVELAVKIAASIPMESRDVAVMYPMPETPIRKDLMEVEKTPLPTIASGDGKDAELVSEEIKDKQSHSKAGMLNKLSSGLGIEGSSVSSGIGVLSNPSSATVGPPPNDNNRVRIAAFLAVEVRGKHHLVKAPVWTLA